MIYGRSASEAAAVDRLFSVMIQMNVANSTRLCTCIDEAIEAFRERHAAEAIEALGLSDIVRLALKRLFRRGVRNDANVHW